jgi:hypothetical protein
MFSLEKNQRPPRDKRSFFALIVARPFNNSPLANIFIFSLFQLSF